MKICEYHNNTNTEKYLDFLFLITFLFLPPVNSTQINMLQPSWNKSQTNRANIIAKY